MQTAIQPLQSLLNESKTHPKIKQTLKLICQTRQKIVFHAYSSSNETYLQVRGLADHDYDEFSYINKILHSRITGVMGKIKRQELNVKNLHQQEQQLKKQQLQAENQVDQELVAQVEHVINNIDLPISLFKRNDKYWYPQNPKTIEAKNYVHNRISQQNQRKKKRRMQKKKKEQQLRKRHEQEMQKEKKMQEDRQRQRKQFLEKKIEELKRKNEQRQKNISQSQKFGSQLKPLFKRIQKQNQKHQMEALETQKSRLAQMRKIHQSIDIAEIKQRQKKFEQYERTRQKKTIFNKALNVSFKSKYHSSMSNRSRMSQYETSRSLYEKKRQYGQIVRKEYKPQLNQSLVQEMQQRLKIMNRKRTRKNPKKKQIHKKSDSDDQDDSEQQQEIKSQPKDESKVYNSDEQWDSEEQDKPVPRIRGQDEDPDRKQRYQMGCEYLEYMKSMRKKKKQQANNKNQEQQDNQSKYQKTKTSHRYKDYLRQFTKTNRTTIDHIDTSKLKNQYNKSIIGQDYGHLTRFQNDLRNIEQKAKNQQQLLKYRKMKSSDANDKKIQIDSAMVETIKARLALMG